MNLNKEAVFFELANAYFKQTDLAFELPFANFDDDVIVDNDILLDKMFDATIPVTFFENYLANTENEEVIENYLLCLYLSDQHHKLITFLEYKNIEESHSFFYLNAQIQKAIKEENNSKVAYWQSQMEMKKSIETDTDTIKSFDLIIETCKEYLGSFTTETNINNL